MVKKEQYVTEADWAFATLKGTHARYVGSDTKTVVSGKPKLYPRTIHITEKKRGIKQPVAEHTVQVEQPVSEQSTAVRNAYVNLRVARRNAGLRS